MKTRSRENELNYSLKPEDAVNQTHTHTDTMNDTIIERETGVDWNKKKPYNEKEKLSPFYLFWLTWSALSHTLKTRRQVGAGLSLFVERCTMLSQTATHLTASARLMWNIVDITVISFRSYFSSYSAWARTQIKIHIDIRYTTEESVRFHQLQRTVEFFFLHIFVILQSSRPNHKSNVVSMIEHTTFWIKQQNYQ